MSLTSFDNQSCAVVVPVYKECLSKSELYSFERTTQVLKGQDVFVVCPDYLFGKLDKLKNKNVEFIYIPGHYFASIAAYNRMLMSGFFYQFFLDYDYILVVQLDALVISDNLNYWCNAGYSYIGAPWFDGYDLPQKPLKLIGVGNGGFSLRKISDFNAVLKKIKYIPYLGYTQNSNMFIRLLKYIKHHIIFSYNRFPFLPRVNEDIFWSILVPHCFHFFKIPSCEEAIKFAFEADPRVLYKINDMKLPFGCHAWEKYDRDFWVEKLNINL